MKTTNDNEQRIVLMITYGLTIQSNSNAWIE